MPRFFCAICDEWVEHEADNVMEGVSAGFAHFRELHPEIDIETWPDGEPVVVDQSLTAGDFAS